MIEDKAAHVGIDWATTAHQVCVLDADGAVLGERSFPHSGEGLLELADWVRQTAAVDPHRIAVGIEVPHGPVVEGLMDAGFRVHALDPKQLDRLRDRFTVAGAKDDRRDAYVLADALRTDARFYRHLEPLHPTVVELREWSRIAQDLAAERNRLANRFRHQLWRYHPHLLELSDDWAKRWILDLWELAPTPSKARRVRTSTLAAFLRRARVRRWTPEALQEQLRRPTLVVADGVTEACVAQCRLTVARLRMVIDQLKEAHRRLEVLSDDVAALPGFEGQGEGPARRHSAPEILRSLPGIGPVVLAALLSEAHDAIARRDAAALRGLSGVAPVTRRSGKQTLVLMRTACPRQLRTAVHHWARVAAMRDPHSRHRYAALRARGHSHARALRSIGSRLIGVACAMLRSGTLFDPTRAPQPALAS